jgi:hypothetical protein
MYVYYLAYQYNYLSPKKTNLAKESNEDAFLDMKEFCSAAIRFFRTSFTYYIRHNFNQVDYMQHNFNQVEKLIEKDYLWIKSKMEEYGTMLRIESEEKEHGNYSNNSEVSVQEFFAFLLTAFHPWFTTQSLEDLLLKISYNNNETISGHVLSSLFVNNEREASYNAFCDRFKILIQEKTSYKTLETAVYNICGKHLEVAQENSTLFNAHLQQSEEKYLNLWNNISGESAALFKNGSSDTDYEEVTFPCY